MSLTSNIVAAHDGASSATSGSAAYMRLFEALETAGGAVLRYGLVAILVYYGVFKFTGEEARAISPLLTNSPLMNWMPTLLGTQGSSNLIGIAELIIAGLIALRPRFPWLSAVGSLLAVGMFLTTLSFLFSTPGLWHYAEWFPFPVANETGGFLLKDVFLLGAASWSAGEALRSS